MNQNMVFNFHHLPYFKLSYKNKDFQELLMKWSMRDGFSIQVYSFDKPFKKYHEMDFLMDFLSCELVTNTLLKMTPDRKMVPINASAESLKFSEINCTYTTLEVFDNLKDGKIAYKDGRIRKCLPEFIRLDEELEREGYEIEIFDNLRKLIISDEEHSENFDEIKDALSDTDRKEFLVKLFSHLVTGGSLCQTEEELQPYIDCTRILYKELVGVAAVALVDASKEKFANVGGGDVDQGRSTELRVISQVYKIHSVQSRGSPEDLLFHKKYLNNFFYVIVNPLKQTVFTLYHHV